jgi:hypothetical protein
VKDRVALQSVFAKLQIWKLTYESYKMPKTKVCYTLTLDQCYSRVRSVVPAYPLPLLVVRSQSFVSPSSDWSRGYDCCIIMPDDVAIEKVQVLEKLGAKVERVRPGKSLFD